MVCAAPGQRDRVVNDIRVATVAFQIGAMFFRDLHLMLLQSASQAPKVGLLYIAVAAGVFRSGPAPVIP